ncbi:MAG TPA: polysaccharide deacetylase family protein [Labilithrix sp.]|nr:polysaccharide deacetylase family protein [Labilithrix sp.]
MGGLFVISLDFELHWGVRDHTSVDAYRDHLLGVRQAVPAMLDLFARRDIAATWATVGFLFAETKKDLERHFPRLLPKYDNPKLSPYEAMGDVGEDEAHDPFHFAPSLLRQIAKTPRQEIGTHTFSHYYCLEAGQTPEQFEADLEAAERIGASFGDTCRSIVFPRNQFAASYLEILRRRGIRTFRSNGNHWAYRAQTHEPKRRRLYRLADAYLPLSGTRTNPRPKPSDAPVDVPASAFLRPWSRRLRRLEPLRQRRIAQAMQRAAERDEVFHLWWHPHNFGKHPQENLAFLGGLLDVFDDLRRRRGMESVTMAQASSLVS